MKTAAPLRSQKDLRYQAIFSIGAPGSGKSFVLNKWLKWAPGASGAPEAMSPETTRALEEGQDLSKFSPKTQQEVQRLKSLSTEDFGLSPLDLRKIKSQLKQYSIEVMFDQDHKAYMPFKLVDTITEDEIPRSQWEKHPLIGPMYDKLKDIGILDVQQLVQRGSSEVPSYFSQINPDAVKPGIPGFDPKNPGLVHTLSSSISKAAFLARVETGDPIIVDGTGASFDKVANFMKLCRQKGYKVTLVWARVPLIVNHIRNATRHRSLPPALVTSQYRKIEDNFPKFKQIADRSVVVNNRSEKINERGQLELDAFDIAQYQKHRTRVDALYQRMGFDSFYDYVTTPGIDGYQQFQKELPEWESVLTKGVKDRSQGGFRSNPRLASIASRIAKRFLYNR